MSLDSSGSVRSGPFPIHPSDMAFYAQAGACLMEWSSIDTVLFDICTLALMVNKEIASIVYARTPTLETRVVLVRELLGVRFPKKTGEHDNTFIIRFYSLSKQILDLAKIRNKVAHGGRQQITHVAVDPQPTPAQPTPGFHSVVSSPYYKSGNKKGLDLDALRGHQKAVFELSINLRTYRTDLLEALHE